MDNEVYFRSMTDEINGVKNRVRDWLGKQWPSDGAWKESVLRAILRRHLPETVGIGNIVCQFRPLPRTVDARKTVALGNLDPLLIRQNIHRKWIFCFTTKPSLLCFKMANL